MDGLRSDLISELERRKWDGILQSEVYPLLGFSRSHVSETLSDLESEGTVMRRREGKSAFRLWLRSYFPGYVPGHIRVGILRSSEYIPFLSSLKRTADSSGSSLEILPFDNALDLISHLHHFVIDIALAPTFTHVLFSLTSRREKIVCSVATGGSAVVYSGRSNDDVLASSESSTMSLISRKIIEEEGLRFRFFEEPGSARDCFLEGDYRYLTIWEPYLSDLSSRAGMHVVEGAGSNTFTDPCCSAGVSESFLAGDGELVRRIGQDYSDILLDLNDVSMDFGLSSISEVTGYTEKYLKKTLSSYHFSNRLDIEKLGLYMINVGIPVSTERLKDMLMN